MCWGLKDMAGLMKPAAARALIGALKDEVGLPIHFHTHRYGRHREREHSCRSRGRGRTQSTCDGRTVPATPRRRRSARVVEALSGSERDTGLDNRGDPRDLELLGGGARGLYAAFESGMQSPASEV